MNWLRRFRGLTIGLVSLPLLWAAGCARPDSVKSEAHTDPHPVPFQNGQASPSRQGQAPVAQDNPVATLPFHDSQIQDAQNLPAGTLLTVRLKNPISAENPGVNGTFEAVVDDPVVIEGNKLVPRGATVAGRVESARVSNVKRDLGYVRLALDSIHVADVNLTIQTASLFVRGTAGDPRMASRTISPGTVPPGEAAAVIRLEKGRRLTFRLTESAYVAASQRTPGER